MEPDVGDSHGARPVHLIITMIKWIRTSRLPINNSLPSPLLLGGIRVHGARRGVLSSLELRDTQVYEP